MLEKGEPMLDSPNRPVVMLALALLVVQSVHMFEHVAQVIQKFALGYVQAHGLLGSLFDFEWVHFVFNVSLEAAIVLLFFWCRQGDPRRAPFALVGGMWFQGYHALEHVVKLYQYYALGIAEAPRGILGYVFPLIWLHFFLNLVTLLFIVGMWRGTRAVATGELVPVPARQ